MIPILKFQVGAINFNPVPPRAAVTVSGGGRAVNERLALDGTVIVQRAAKPASRRLAVQGPDGYALLATQTALLEALAGAGTRFTLSLRGYELEGDFSGCFFEDPPSFPPFRSPLYKRFSFTIYIPQ